MNFQDRLKNLRNYQKLTQFEVGKLLGVSENTVRNWERGVKKPSMDALIGLSRLYETSLDDLVGNAPAERSEGLNLSRQELRLLSDYRKADKAGRELIRLVSQLEAKRCEEKEKPEEKILRMIPRYFTPAAAGISAPLDGQDYEQIPVTGKTPDGADFAVTIQGESMEPLIHDGQTVYVHRQESLLSGQIGIFSVDGAMYCKTFLPQEDGSLLLRSENPGAQDCNVYVDAESSQNVRCYGRVLL